MFLKYGRKHQEIVVTGNPAFDQLTKPEIIRAGMQLRHDRGWNDGRKIILWASQIEPERHPFANLAGDPLLPRKVESVLRNIVASDKKLRLVVRYHPSERAYFHPAPRIDFSPISDSISTLLHAVDVVVVTASTVGLEAALAGRKVISIDTSVFTPDTNYEILGISKGVTNLENLESVLREELVQLNDVYAQVINNRTSVERVLDVIDSLID
jgi:CDP-glycerol glycerophosphotransferase (TagB/SpsB family)